MKTVIEVCKITGLTPKIIDDYDRERIVLASNRRTRGYEDSEGRNYRGYKEYDDEAIMKLQLVAIFRKLGLSRSEIKEKMTAPDFECNKVLKEQVIMLKKKKEEIENLIIMAEQLRMVGLGNELVRYYAREDASKFAEKMKILQNSDLAKRFYLLDEEQPEEFSEIVNPLLEELWSIKQEDCNTEQTMKIVQNLFEVIMKQYGFMGFILLIGIALSGVSGGDAAEEINASAGEDITSIPSVAIMNYFKNDMKRLRKELISIMAQHYDALERPFSDEVVEYLVDDLKELIAKHFGISEKDEYRMVFEVIEFPPYTEPDDYLSYVLNAVKYYCR